MRGLQGWIIRRALASRAGLLYVDRDGRVTELGAITADELRSLSWAWGVAYRGARGAERSRLARSRDAAARVGRAAAELKKAEREGVQDERGMVS